MFVLHRRQHSHQPFLGLTKAILQFCKPPKPVTCRRFLPHRFGPLCFVVALPAGPVAGGRVGSQVETLTTLAVTC